MFVCSRGRASQKDLPDQAVEAALRSAWCNFFMETWKQNDLVLTRNSHLDFLEQVTKRTSYFKETFETLFKIKSTFLVWVKKKYNTNWHETACRDGDKSESDRRIIPLSPPESSKGYLCFDPAASAFLFLYIFLHLSVQETSSTIFFKAHTCLL